MATNDLTKFFNIMFDKRQTFDIAEGILQDKRGLTGRVSFVGNPVSQPVFIMGSAKDVSVGNRCLCVRPKTSAKWIVLGSFGTQQTGYLPQREPEDGFEIYPPTGIAAVDAIPGSCMWSWYAPPEKSVVFEVQSSLTGTEDDVVTELRTRGSYFIKASDVNVFLRVRSIQSDYNHSAWSSFYECAPGTAGVGVGTVTSVSLTTPSELTTAGSPVTSSGGFTVSWATQSANKIFAGPSSGSAAAPTFRDAVMNDLPSINAERLVGRYSGTAGKMQEILIGAGLYLDGNSLNASGSGGTPATGVIYKATTDINSEVVLFDEVLLSDSPYFDVDFSIISAAADCRDLRIVAQLRGDQGGTYNYGHWRVNGASDSTGQAMIRQIARNGTSSTDQSFQFAAEIASNTSPSDSFTVLQGWLNDFQGSQRKIIFSSTASLNDGSFPYNIEFFNNDLGTSSPITELKLESTTYPNPGTATGNFKAGSRLTIYGTVVKTVVTDVTGDIGITVDQDHLIGRYSPGTGQFEQIALGMGLYLIGDTLYASATGSGGGSGTVTSVDISLPVELNVTGNPITSAGTFAITKADQNANKVWAGPTTGADAAPTFRVLVGDDMPTEDLQDMIASFIAAGANISVTYNDAGNTLTIAVTGLTSAQISDFTEAAQDATASLVTAGTNISVVYNDAGNTLTISVTGLTASTISDFSEAVDDRVSSLLVAGPNIGLTYDDSGNTLTISSLIPVQRSWFGI